MFGTEAIYNDDEYVKSHSELQYKASWGRLGVRLKQFYTLYRMHSTLTIVLLQFSACTARQQVIFYIEPYYIGVPGLCAHLLALSPRRNCF